MLRNIFPLSSDSFLTVFHRYAVSGQRYQIQIIFTVSEAIGILHRHAEVFTHTEHGLPLIKPFVDHLTVDDTDGIIISETKETNPAVVYNAKTISDEIAAAQAVYGGLTFNVDSIELLTADGKEHLNDARLTVNESGVIKWDNHGAALQEPFLAKYRVTYYVLSGNEPFTNKLCKMVVTGNITCLPTEK